MPDQKRTVGWIAAPVAFSPMILCTLFGLLALALSPRGTASETCAALLWEGMMLTVIRLQQAYPDMSPCSVLAVQASAILPVTLFLLALLTKRLPSRRPTAKVDVNILVILFVGLVTYALWIDLFFVGATYLMAGSRPRSGLWFGGTSFASWVSVVCAVWVIVAIRQRILAHIDRRRQDKILTQDESL